MLTSDALLVPKGHPPTRVIQVRVAYAATWAHGDTWERTVSGACGPAVARVFVDVMTPITTEGHATAHRLGCHMKSY